MNTIEQRILIPTSPEIVWHYICDLSNNPKWQQHCVSISYLTSSHQGAGARWRYRTRKGKEYVAEITAWYDRIGYEYEIIDGGPFHANLGRIRLQDTPDGTIVQWTFSYETRGALSGLRNSLSTRRNLENNIVDSLWQLWREMGENRQQIPYEAKSLMRDAPDVEERAQYTPRHQLSPITVESDEPPIADDDTRPRLPVQMPEEPAPAEEPEFLANIPDESSDIYQSAIATSGLPTPVVEPEPAAPAIATSPPIDPKDDSGKVSVFEVFGVPKPSETQEARSIVTDTSQIVKTSVGENRHYRQGLRSQQRRTLVRLRPPQSRSPA